LPTPHRPPKPWSRSSSPRIGGGHHLVGAEVGGRGVDQARGQADAVGRDLEQLGRLDGPAAGGEHGQRHLAAAVVGLVARRPLVAVERQGPGHGRGHGHGMPGVLDGGEDRHPPALGSPLADQLRDHVGPGRAVVPGGPIGHRRRHQPRALGREPGEGGVAGVLRPQAVDHRRPHRRRRRRQPGTDVVLEEAGLAAEDEQQVGLGGNRFGAGEDELAGHVGPVPLGGGADGGSG
jgi:hypothetical protein